ncbi:BatD family protein [Cupriavidus sp. DL-D2]|uniref:BatD family protein n=1 Tax=Cupriavidus sp. DL-D2 TaxID=3144974 RepID=UPI003213D96C
MQRHLAALLLTVFACLLPIVALAAAEPIIRVEVGAQQPVRVGQQVSIDVTILAPNFFMSAPAFPVLQVPGAVVTMPDERALNSTETINGVAYAGIRKSYAFTAEQDGDFELPATTVRFTYADDNGAPREGSVSFPPTRIRAGAGGTVNAGGPKQPLVPVSRLVVTQALDHALDKGSVALRKGDALVRTVTTFAPQTQAMLIQPPHAPAPSGVRVFQADPRLSDNARTTAGPGGTRVDTITYVFERTGSYVLPPVTVDWLDPATGRPATSQAAAIKVEVSSGHADGALAPDGSAFGWLGEGGSFWRIVIGCVCVLLAAMVAMLAYRHGRPMLARWRQWQAERSRRRAESAEFRLASVLRACAASDAAAAYLALGDWTRAAHGMPLDVWAASTGDASLMETVTALQRHLYGARSESDVWNGKPLAEALQRHAATPQTRRHPPAASALPPLNPAKAVNPP